MRALLLLASFPAMWAGTAMLLSCLPWLRDSVSLVERLAPCAPNVEASWTDEAERWWARWTTPGRPEAWVRSTEWRPVGITCLEEAMTMVALATKLGVAAGHNWLVAAGVWGTAPVR